MKEIKALFFFIILIFSFPIDPVVASFDKINIQLINDSHLLTDINKLRKFDTLSSFNQQGFVVSNSKMLDDPEKIVVYNPNKISIFAKAVESLFQYYVPDSGSLEPQQSQFLLPSRKMERNQDKVYNAAVPKDPSKIIRPFPKGSRYVPKEFFFEYFDEYKNVKIPQYLVRNGHMAVRKQFGGLPRLLTEKDSKVKLSTENVKSMFIAHYNDYFQFDFKKQYGKNVTEIKPKRIPRKLSAYWKTEARWRNKCFDKLRKDLFENDSVVKLTGCRYSYFSDPVTIYYNLNTDLFGIVDEPTNVFITGGVASLCDYIDIYYFRWLGIQQTLNQSLNFFVPEEEEIGPLKIPLRSIYQEYEDYDQMRDFGLPKNYNPENWWENTKNELIDVFLESSGKTSDWYNSLIEFENNITSEFEAFTALQLEAENYISGVYRPQKQKGSVEERLNTDFRFQTFNSKKILGCQPTILDVKVPIDPAALEATKTKTGLTVRTIEEQVNDIVRSVKFQQKRSTTEFNETTLHVINLIRIRPIDRSLFMTMFKLKAIKNEINLDSVIFLNTSYDSIF